MDDSTVDEAVRRRIERRRKTINHSSITSIDNLPGSLLSEILVRVTDSRYVVRCKAVCKYWFSLISDPHFVHRSIHIHHHQCFQPDGNWLNFLIQYNRVDEDGILSKHLQPVASTPNLKPSDSNQHHILKFLPCFREDDTRPIYVAASFSDLLVCCECAPNQCTPYQRVYYICNPLTKQWLVLPPSPYHRKTPLIGFVCYPAYCSDNKQPCLTSARYNYKVVRILTYGPLPIYNKFHAEIFCSQSGEWKTWEVSSPKPLRDLSWLDAIVTYNGILHWQNSNHRNIVAYDPLNNVEQCRIIDLPTDYIRGVLNYTLGVCGGSLRMAQLTGCYDLSILVTFNVWELEDYDAGKWQLLHKINVPDMVSNDSWLAKQANHGYYTKILAFHPFDVDIVFLSYYERFVSYNTRTRTLKLVSMLQCDGEHITTIKWQQVYPVVHPWWPTPVPPLPADAPQC